MTYFLNKVYLLKWNRLKWNLLVTKKQNKMNHNEKN